MTVLGIQYLTGCSVATNLAKPRTPEFPPHFGRVFMALAATYFETRGDEREREALEWLESAGAPSISASKLNARSFVETYVPVNDKHGGIGGRSRQPRSFPTTRPDSPFVYMVWDAKPPEMVRGGLERLCNKVTRLGHSSSLVQMWVTDEGDAICPDWVPSSRVADEQMRLAEPGTLAYLERAFKGKQIEEYNRLSEEFEASKGKSRAALKKQIDERFPAGKPKTTRPVLTRWQAYKFNATDESAEEKVSLGPFDPKLIVFRSKEEQRIFGLEATLQLTSALRDAAMKATGVNVPEWLSGHQPDGRPSLRPHAAFFPLPFVGARHADGHVMGLAMAIPRQIEPSDESRDASLRRVLEPLLFRDTGKEKNIRLWRGDAWEWNAERETREYPPINLREETWTGPSSAWGSVTPVVLHHYPKRNRENDVERIVLEAFESAGFPQPVELRTQPESIFEGAGHVKQMPEFSEGGENMCRYQVHVVVRFRDPVQGPMLVGRGRFRGYGLLRPMEVKHG